MQQTGLRIAVFAEGLARIARDGTTVFRWDDIVEVRQSIVRQRGGGGTTHVYRILDGQGRKAMFDDKIGGVKALGETIQQEVTRRLLPKSLVAYNAGETLTFGKFSLSKEGLSRGKEALPWDEVESVAPSIGRIEVKRKGKRLTWASQAVADIPNVYVLIALTKTILGTKT